ncbi:hypothetical protein DMUE_5127 [Dictyocoela muelleri]|nr:hypothetical protein DMUE_5127 [Dictyocoela muelleri]
MLFSIFLMISLCLAHEYMQLKGMKKNNQKKLNNKKKSLRGDRKMDYLDLWTSYYSYKNCNNILKNEINKPIIKLDEKLKFECREKSCQNKNCNNYHLNILNKCDWNNLNEDEVYKFKTFAWNNYNFKSDNCDGACHDTTDDLIHNNLKCSCLNCCYLNTNCNNKNLNKENYTNQNLNNQNYTNQNLNNQNYYNQNLNNQNLNNQNFNNQNLNNQNLNNQNFYNQHFVNQYPSNQNLYNQYSENPYLNNCYEVPDIKTIIIQPDNSFPSHQPNENVSENQKEIYEDVIYIPPNNSNPNNISAKSEMEIKDAPFNNFSSYENCDVLTNQQNNNELYIPAVKYESFFNANDNKINKGEEINLFNQNCKNYHQNIPDPPNYTISKPHEYFYENKNNNEINRSLNKDYQILKYDDLSNYDLKMNPENQNQNNDPVNEVGDGKGSLNKDSKSKINKNQKVNKKKKDDGKKINSKNSCVGYISTLIIVWLSMLILI